MVSLMGSESRKMDSMHLKIPQIKTDGLNYCIERAGRFLNNIVKIPEWGLKVTDYKTMEINRNQNQDRHWK